VVGGEVAVTVGDGVATGVVGAGVVAVVRGVGGNVEGGVVAGGPGGVWAVHPQVMINPITTNPRIG